MLNDNYSNVSTDPNYQAPTLKSTAPQPEAFFSEMQIFHLLKFKTDLSILSSACTLECSTTPSLLSISFSSLAIFFSIPQAAENSPFSSFLSSLAYLLSTDRGNWTDPWNFDPARLSFITLSISFILNPFICSIRFNFMFVIYSVSE